MLAGPSAARSYGLWAGIDRRLHISVGANASRLRTNVPPSFGYEPLTPDRSSREIVLHWLQGGAPPELGPECWRVTLPVCLRQVVAWCDRTDAIACLETALTSQGWSTRQLASVFQSEPIASRLVVSAARAGSDSGPESLVCQRLRRRGLVLRQQVRIPGVGRVDIRVVGTRVVIEVDGRTYHEDPAAFEEDRRRDAELVARGYIVVRLSYRRVMDDWPWCERMVLAAIAPH
jgi:very-short-patch-repair endonuclease